LTLGDDDGCMAPARGLSSKKRKPSISQRKGGRERSMRSAAPGPKQHHTGFKTGERKEKAPSGRGATKNKKEETVRRFVDKGKRIGLEGKKKKKEERPIPPLAKSGWIKAPSAELGVKI